MIYDTVESPSVRRKADCTSSSVIAAYSQVRFIPEDSCALHLELSTVSSIGFDLL